MHLETIHLKNFRNYQEADISFSSGTNLILGNNGVGKTNLLEAIYMLSTSKSFRNVSDKRIKKWDTDNYFVKGLFSSERGKYDISIEYLGDRKRLKINSVFENKISNIIGYVYCVFFFFEDIFLIKGPPRIRRNFLDLILSTVDPLYFNKLKIYINVIKQKNRYLKDSNHIERSLLSSWNEQLIESGSYIVQKRYLLINFINFFIETSLKDQFPFRLVYQTNVSDINERNDIISIKESFNEELLRKEDKEIIYAQSLIGSHRDDIFFTDGKLDLRYFGSVGESRLSAIILKLAQAFFYYKTKNILPILLIDDILFELDRKNIERVLHLICEDSQKFITTTESKNLPEIFLYDRVFHIKDKGNVSWKEI